MSARDNLPSERRFISKAMIVQQRNIHMINCYSLKKKKKLKTFWTGYSFARLIGPFPSLTDDMETTVFHWKIVQMFQLPTDKSHFPTICLCTLPTVKFQPLDTLKIWLYKFLVATQLRLDPYRHWHQTNVFLLSPKSIPWCLGYRDKTQE